MSFYVTFYFFHSFYCSGLLRLRCLLANKILSAVKMYRLKGVRILLLEHSQFLYIRHIASYVPTDFVEWLRCE